MKVKIYRNTVTDLLWGVLTKLMTFQELKPFRLVGGTSLSLQLGHRMSADIDLFTDAEYNTVDFKRIDNLLTDTFQYVSTGFEGNQGLGKSYYIGNEENDAVKLDLFYTDAFVFPVLKYEEIRFSRVEEILAMKLEIIGQKGRKKDFWDIHELMEHFTWVEMLDLYVQRYPYHYSRAEIIKKLTDFDEANDDLEPICLKGKYWELIKLDIEESISSKFGK